MNRVDEKTNGSLTRGAKPFVGRIGLMAGMAVLLMLMSIPARGHVLEGAHILELMTQTLSGAKTLRVEQQVAFEEFETEALAPVLPETLTYAFPDRFRLEMQDGDNSRIFVRVNGETLSIINGHRTETGENRFDRYANLLLYRDRELLHKMLLTYDVDVEKSSLGWFEGRVVYVLGAQYPDESAPQVWVDKESLLPLRWIAIADNDGNDRLEFIYRDWQKKNNLWYPVRIELWYDQRLIRRIIAVDWQVDVELAQGLFDLSQLMRTFPPEPSTVLPGPDDSDIDEVERTIQQFQKKFED